MGLFCKSMSSLGRNYSLCCIEIVAGNVKTQEKNKIHCNQTLIIIDAL